MTPDWSEACSVVVKATHICEPCSILYLVISLLEIFEVFCDCNKNVKFSHPTYCSGGGGLKQCGILFMYDK